MSPELAASGLRSSVRKSGARRALRSTGQAVERPKYRPYDLRHFYASMLIERKVNLKKIQTLMGHANIETTLNVYGHLIEDADVVPAAPIGLLSRLNVAVKSADALV